MSKSDDKQRNIFRENVIHVGAGFVAKERPHVLEALSTLGPHLGRWDSRDVDIEVTLQDRGGKEQRVTLRTSLPGLPPLVAVADNPDLTRALGEAKRELIRQLEHQKSAREPMSNRRLRNATIRHPADTRHKPTSSSLLRADRETVMTHITEERVIGKDAGMGGSTTVATRTSLTVTDILRAGVRRRTTRNEMTAAQSTWDSEGGTTREGESLRSGTEGLLLAPLTGPVRSAPRGLGR